MRDARLTSSFCRRYLAHKFFREHRERPVIVDCVVAAIFA
jgi:hypothetical protein